MDTAKNLHSKGINVHLDIVGIKGKINEYLPDYVENHGFVSKSTEKGEQKINELFEKAHFFILPTRAECFGVVFCEASSFGVPSLITKTGGVPSAVRDGINGKLFELSDSAEKYAEYIQWCLEDFNEYKKLCLSSFEEYEHRLNWDVVGKTIIECIKKAGERKLQ